MAEESDLQRALREAEPAWRKDGFGIRGPQTSPPPPPPPSESEVSRTPRQPFFPEATPTTTEEQVAAAAAARVAFHVTNVSVQNTTTHVWTFQVSVVDGKINDEYPSGMGYGGYVLTIAEEAYQQVYAIVTYDEDTLEITSRTLGLSDDPPDSESGTLIIPLADIAITYTGGGDPVVTVTQLDEGNIKMAFVYGSMNGQPALLAVRVYGDWIPVALT